MTKFKKAWIKFKEAVHAKEYRIDQIKLVLKRLWPHLSVLGINFTVFNWIGGSWQFFITVVLLAFTVVDIDWKD